MRAGFLRDLFVTAACWLWFTLGFILFYSWRYAFHALLTRKPETGFQHLNSRFYKTLFSIIKITAPRQKWEIDEEVKAIRSAVIVCNHLSYLDPLLLIALYERHRTIAKTRFFNIPVFGWVIKKAGYLAAATEGRFAGMMIDQMATMPAFLQSGGNFFCFPEGARSLEGKIGTLNRGAMKIARLCQAPIYVLQLANTHRLFAPGKFIFQANAENTISLKIIARITPDYLKNTPSASELDQRVREAYEAR
jgi:1-acyl-sn-glycerol-3-phosphate acyltransferase